jgi:catechol 2,3-dioxygenase-like lactoylglutathione lyase family enzyme
VSARINHIATNSGNSRQVGGLYEVVFGMWFDETPRSPACGQVLTDGNITLNLQARAPGYRGGLDHFGIEVDDIDAVFDKLKSDYPKIGWVDRPPSSPFPGYMSHDPAGSIFAISEKGATSVTAPTERPITINFARFNDADPSARFVHHYAIRTKRIEECAEFYEDVFGFSHTSDDGDDPNHYLSDGRVTLMLVPWHINIYGGISVTGRGPDHIGFIVEDVAAVQTEIENFFNRFAPGQALLWLFNDTNKISEESPTMERILDESCPMSSYHLTDRDGVFIAIGDKTFTK